MTEPHDRPSDELRDRAQQYVLGTLPEPEREGFDEHLARGCAVCASEVRATQELAGRLAFSAPASAPPAELKDVLLRRIRSERPSTAISAAAKAQASADARADAVQTWKAWPAAGASQFLRHDEGAFEPTGVKGVSVRRLFVDASRKSATMLIRMEPGASYPGHRHGGVEECYVLSGDLHHVDGDDDPKSERVMRSGDFEAVDEGSRHGRQWTERGCLLLIRSSLSDELEP